MRVDKSKWEKAKLGEVVTFKRGLTYPKEVESQIKTNNVILRSNNIDLETHSLCFDEVKYLDENFNVPSDKFLRKDDLFICMSNGSAKHIGKVALIPCDLNYAFGGFMGAISPLDSILPKFLFYTCLSASYYNFLSKVGNGINITNLKFSTLKEFVLLLPTLAEQRAIAEELDGIQSMIGKCREQLDDYDRLARSIFHEMFGDPVKNDKGWEVKTLGEVCEEVSAGGDKPLGYTKERTSDNTIPIFANGKDKDGLYGFCAEAKVNKHCLSISGRGTIGYAVIHREPFTPIVRLIVAIPKQDLLLEYFKAVLAWIEFESTGNTIPQLTVPLFKKHSIPLPPLPLQQQFATRIEAIEKMKEATKAQLADLQQLFDSRMQYYFS